MMILSIFSLSSLLSIDSWAWSQGGQKCPFNIKGSNFFAACTRYSNILHSMHAKPFIWLNVKNI